MDDDLLDVLIVGAGPTGLVLALELVLRGVRVRIIDKAAGPGTASRAMAVHARTLEFYRRLQLADEVISRGIRVGRVHLRERRVEAARIEIADFGKGLSPYPFVLSFPQDEHEKVLGDRLRREGVEVEWQTELAGLDDDGGRVHATLRSAGGEESVEAAWICGCDGVHSRVRDGMEVGFPGGTYEQSFYVADVEATGVATDGDLNLCLGTDLFCVVFPIRTTGRFRLIGIIPRPLRGKASVTLEDIRPFVEDLVGIRVRKEKWFSTYQVHHRVAAQFHKGRAFLVGDAGHVHSPAGGQGMNTGIGDAVNLAWKLAAVVRGRASEQILDSYEPERIAFARTLVATTDTVFTGVVDPHLRGRFIRRVLIPNVVPRLIRFPFFRRFMFRTLSQIRIHYRDSALASGMAGNVHGGDRLPWVESVDNFAPLRSLGWQLHVYGKARAALAEFARSRALALQEFDWSADAGRAGLARDAAYLIRPDTYVALASATQDVAELQRFIDRFAIVP